MARGLSWRIPARLRRAFGKTTRRAPGLTLLEVVMTVAVLAVLGALALPGLGAQLERQRLRHAAQTLAGDIAEARYLAAQRGQAVHLMAQAGPDWCWSVSMDPGCGCGSPQPCRIHTVAATQHPGITLLAPLTLRLDPSGLPQSTASATLQSPRGDQLRVDVGAQGRARICAISGTWPQTPAC